METGAPRCTVGDSTSDAAFAEALGGRKAHFLHTDPPYCLLTRRRRGGDERDKKGRKLDHGPVTRFETVRDYQRFTEAWLPKALACLHPSSVAAIWTNFLGKAPISKVAAACGFPVLYGEFAWAKPTTDRSGPEQLCRVFEVALVFGQTPLLALTPEDGPRPWSVIAGYDEEGTAERYGNHPNHKPFSVVEPLLRQFSRPGGLVLDCFAGSGSIPAAAQRLGRQVACIEREPEWAARVTARLSGG